MSKKKKEKISLGTNYYYIAASDFSLAVATWFDSDFQRAKLCIGNVFFTIEKAKEKLDKIKKILKES